MGYFHMILFIKAMPQWMQNLAFVALGIEGNSLRTNVTKNREEACYRRSLTPLTSEGISSQVPFTWGLQSAGSTGTQHTSAMVWGSYEVNIAKEVLAILS